MHPRNLLWAVCTLHHPSILVILTSSHFCRLSNLRRLVTSYTKMMPPAPLQNESSAVSSGIGVATGHHTH